MEYITLSRRIDRFIGEELPDDVLKIILEYSGKINELPKQDTNIIQIEYEIHKIYNNYEYTDIIKKTYCLRCRKVINSIGGMIRQRTLKTHCDSKKHKRNKNFIKVKTLKDLMDNLEIYLSKKSKYSYIDIKKIKEYMYNPNLKKRRYRLFNSDNLFN
jgi:hypothetical protein